MSVGVLRPVRRAYKSGQKGGGEVSPAVRLGLGKWSEGLSDPRRDTQTNAGFPQETEGEIHRRRETQSQSPRQTNTRTEKGGAQANSERWMGPRSRNAAEAPHRSFGERATGRRRATRVSPHTLLRLESRARPGKRMCGGVSALEGRRGAQPESLTSSRPEAESPKFAPRDHSSASPFGPEAAQDPAGPAPEA